MLILIAGCLSEPGNIDKEKFSELNKTARALKNAIAPDRPCEVPDTLLQRFISGTAAVKGKAASKAEGDVYDAYTRLVTTYRDGLLFCQYHTQVNQLPFVPKGRIYVFQELDPLVEKYNLATETHLYKPTGAKWRSVSADAINVIWESAERQTRNIENTVNYN